jgi:hypothetical protein
MDGQQMGKHRHARHNRVSARREPDPVVESHWRTDHEYRPTTRGPERMRVLSSPPLSGCFLLRSKVSEE